MSNRSIVNYSNEILYSLVGECYDDTITERRVNYIPLSLFFNS